MATKLKLKIAHIEFEYEGDAVYDSETVKDLFTHLQSFMTLAPSGTIDISSGKIRNDDNSDMNVSDDLSKFGIQTVVARLNIKYTTDFILAAAAYLQICQGNDSFSRAELLATMKNVTGHYNDNVSRNLSKDIKRLITRKKINSLASDRMSLVAAEQATMRAKLAQSG